MRMALYQIINRELSFVKWIDVPDGTKDLCAWKQDAGYGPNYTLRTGIVRDYSQRDIIAELGRPTAPVPSAAAIIAGKLSRA